MLIDWFTVAAQIINFLVLVWLLKRFLYKPILDALDAREKKIAKELADADQKKAEARKELDEFQRKNAEFDQQRDVLMNKATEEAQAERLRLLDEARTAADALSAKRQEALLNDAHNLNQVLSQRTRQEVFAIARKALTDLAASGLEERMTEVFIRRLLELDEQAKGILGAALASASAPSLVRSAFDLPEAQRSAIQNVLNQTFSAEMPLRFETAPDLISGIELTVNGQKVAWSIDDYLASLGKSIDELLKEKDKAEADARAKTRSNLVTKIGKRAYELYEMQGRKDGQSRQNWETAEREIRNGELGARAVESKSAPRAQPEAKAAPQPDTKPEAEIKPETKTVPDAKPEPKLATHSEPIFAKPQTKSK